MSTVLGLADYMGGALMQMSVRASRRLSVIAVVTCSIGLMSCSEEREYATRRPELGDAAHGSQVEAPEAVVLGGLDHVVSGIVRKVDPIPKSFGVSAMVFQVERVEWWADTRWYFGEQQPVSPLVAGQSITVAVDDEWGLGAGDAVTVAVSTIPFSDVEGYARVIVGADYDQVDLGSAEKGERNLRAGSMMRYLVEAADIRKVSLGREADRTAQTELVIELVRGAQAWLDAENRLPAGSTSSPPPEGLVAEVNDAVAGTPAPQEPGVTDLLAVPPSLRQLPFVGADLEELGRALGVELDFAQGAIFDSTKTYTFFALYFDGVGVIGPWSTDRDLSYGRIHGPAVKAGKVELLAWRGEDPAPEYAESLGSFSLPNGWEPGTTSLAVDVSSDEITVHAVTTVDLVARIDALLRTRNQP